MGPTTQLRPQCSHTKRYGINYSESVRSRRYHRLSTWGTSTCTITLLRVKFWIQVYVSIQCIFLRFYSMHLFTFLFNACIYLSVFHRFAISYPKIVTQIANGKALNHVSLLYTSKYCPVLLFYVVVWVQFFHLYSYIFKGSGLPWTWNNSVTFCTVASVLMKLTEISLLLICFSRNRFSSFPSPIMNTFTTSMFDIC